MVCGVLPYHDTESQDLKAPKDLNSYLEKRNQPLNFSEAFEPHIKKVLQKALHHDADQRFNTLDEFCKIFK